jgi:hypothetical protein
VKMAATHFDSWIFLLLVGIAMLFRWLTSLANKANTGSDDADESVTPPPVPRAPAQTDEERIRKFLEALGQPPGTKPPSPITQRPTYQKPLVVPRVPPKPPALPRRIRLPGQITQPPYEEKIFDPRAPETSFDVQEATATAPPVPPPPVSAPAEAYASATRPKAGPAQNSLAALLRSPSGLRNAIVLREVFGPPRSLQPMDLV